MNAKCRGVEKKGVPRNNANHTEPKMQHVHAHTHSLTNVFIAERGGVSFLMNWKML